MRRQPGRAPPVLVPRPLSIAVLLVAIATILSSILLLTAPGGSCPCITREAAATAQLESLAVSIISFHRARGVLPGSLEDLDVPDPEHGWPEGYCCGCLLVRDPWGTRCAYLRGHGLAAVASAGADRSFGTADDLFRVAPVRRRRHAILTR